LRRDKVELDRIDPELRKAAAAFPKLPIGSAFGRTLTNLLLPLMMSRSKPVAGIAIEEVKTSSGQALRIYSPSGTRTRAGMVYIHGGGMIMGSPNMDDEFLSNLALELDMVIVSPNYRLAPKHPFPAALDDCHEAWSWLLKNSSERGVDVSRLAIGGESAGGGLAAGLVLAIHDEGGTQPIAQWLFCPMLDDRTALDRSLDQLNHFVWNNKLNLVGWKSYLGSALGTDQVSAYAAPARRTDFSGLPKAWIGIGDEDLFFEEDRAYANNLKAAGVACEFDSVPMAFHSFQGVAPEAQISKDFLARAKAWLKTALAS